MTAGTSLKKTTEEPLGPLVVVNKLAKAGQTGVLAQGVLEKIEKGVYKKKETTSFFIRGADGTLYIANGTKALREQLDNADLVGKKVRIENNGTKETKGGDSFYDFECFLEE